ncbi:MAG: hypothetical protein JXB17_10530 [Bacteroidales bacterium]|nr:hypothetical protein [Bacteroidales bacterium]
METLNKLISQKEAVDLINQNKTLILAADENILSTLPKGNWIGGTIPYFMDKKGGCFSKDKIFVTDISYHIDNFKIILYDANEVTTITNDCYAHGYSIMLIPCFSEVLAKYALKAQELNNLYNVPIVGWVTGIDLNDVGKVTPKVFNGQTGEKSDSKAILMHIQLPENKLADLEILNIFRQGDGDTFEFLEEGFSCKECFINGQKQNLAEYIEKNNIDTKLPIVADYSGAMINISFQQVDKENKSVLFYAPLRKNVKYKLAKKVDNYVKSFNAIIPQNIDNVAFSCNCILNYLYSELEGKKTGTITGPFTFGEIAYVLVNQTLVYLNIINL